VAAAPSTAVGRRRDAALAVAVLLPVGAAALAAGAPGSLAAAVAGAAGALAVEWVLSRPGRREAVRDRWDRPGVQTGAVVAGLLGAAAAWATVGAWTLTALVGGLVAYLALLGAVAVRDAVHRR
jgi:hypothetical protein